MALSKIWFADKLISNVRVLTNEIIPGKINDSTLLNYFNLAAQDVAETLDGIGAPDYGTTIILTISTGAKPSASLASISYDKIIKVVDSVNGLVAPRPDFDFENLTNITAYASSSLFNHFGQTLYFFTGSQLTSEGSKTLYYYRQPTPMTASADFIDVRDKFVPLVIAKVKQMIYEEIGKTPPESITNTIESKTQEIVAANTGEDTTIKSKQVPAKTMGG